MNKDYIILPAALLCISKLGILLQGPAGCCKTDTVINLLARGHKLVADDNIMIKPINNKLWGFCSGIDNSYLHIRGVGIVNVKAIYGKETLLNQHTIDFIINLSPTEIIENQLDSFSSEKILGISIPTIIIPFCRYRQLSNLIELTVKYFLLKKKGYNVLNEFKEQQRRLMDKQPK